MSVKKYLTKTNPDSMSAVLSDKWRSGMTQVEWIWTFQSSEQRASLHFTLIISRTICLFVTCFVSKSFGLDHLI